MIQFITLILMITTLASYAIAIMSGLTHGHEVQTEWWNHIAGLQACAFAVCLILSARKLLI